MSEKSTDTTAMIELVELKAAQEERQQVLEISAKALKIAMKDLEPLGSAFMHARVVRDFLVRATLAYRAQTIAMSALLELTATVICVVAKSTPEIVKNLEGLQESKNLNKHKN